MTTDGYIRLHRRLLEWEWFADSSTVHVFLCLLLSANWKEGRWLGHVIPPGSVVTSREKIAAATGLTEKQVRRALEILEQGRVIERGRAGKGQLVTLANWAKYQATEEFRADKGPESGPTKGQQLGRQRAGIEEGEEVQEESSMGSDKSEPFLSPPKSEAIPVQEPETPKVPQKVPAAPRSPSEPRKPLAERLEAFQAACKAVTDAEPERLPREMRKAFFAYWTETGKSGRMRWEAEKFFSIGRRMDTWRENELRRVGGAAKVRPDTADRKDMDLTFGTVTN